MRENQVRSRAGLEPWFLRRTLDHAGLCQAGALRRPPTGDVGGARERSHGRAWLADRLDLGGGP